jgi:hypothetical protein
VTARIIKHGEWEDNYDDPEHPIPSLDALDVQTIKKSGGSDLFIVVASPLRADVRSQQRLLEKISIYLKFLATPSFTNSCGKATPLNTNLIVKLHPASDPEIHALLERSKPWVASGGASLKIERIDLQEH